MAMKIPLTQGKYAIVDDADFERINKYKWCALKRPNTFYAVRGGKKINGKQIFYSMHREILNAKKDEEIDHQNSNGLDNKQCNLRFCTHSQNGYNSRNQEGGTSKYKGVCWRKDTKKWVAYIKYQKLIHLGYFISEIDAAKAYNVKARELFGEFARLNFIET